MKPTYQSIITLILGVGLTACVTTEDEMDDVQPFLEGPWGRTYVDPPPPPQPERNVAAEPAPEKETKLRLFGRSKSKESGSDASASETATAVPVNATASDFDVEVESTPAPTPIATSGPDATATLVPEPEKEKRFGFFGRRKDSESETTPQPAPETKAKSSPHAPAATVSFVDDIKPIFQEKCVGCHNSDTLHGRISLESRQLAFGQTPAGPVIVPGNPEGSVLLQNVVTSKTSENAMPPVGHRVTRKEKDLLYAWIMEGARWPDGPSGRIVPDVVARE